MLFKLTIASLWHRRTTAILIMVSVAVSSSLLTGVILFQNQTKASFANTISGVDLIVGARTNPIHLLLYSVFHIGDPTQNISWSSYQRYARQSNIAWTIPISLGDSHRGFRVVGTSNDFFAHFRYANKTPLTLKQGRIFQGVFDAVIGAEVAQQLGYQLGQSIVIAHGISDVSFSRHDNNPFRVVGILSKTGTPLDRTVAISLSGFDAIHVNAQRNSMADLTPESITAFFVGLKRKITTFQVQRNINSDPSEALIAALPGVTLSQLWSLTAVAENALFLTAAAVALSSLIGLMATILVGLNQRRREMAVLRALGVHPWQLAALLMLEAGTLASIGVALGSACTIFAVYCLGDWLASQWSIYINIRMIGTHELTIMAALPTAAIIFALWPAWCSYRYTLTDGISLRS